MTTTTDIDRRIAAFFDDGPTRVSESTIDGVLAHARAHPRRRDPFQALRRDPMGSGPGLGALLRPVPLLAVLVLLIAAAVAGAAVGGWFERDPAVVPPIVRPSPSAAPSSAAPTPPAEARFRVDLIENVGDDAYIEVIDASGTLADATSVAPGDGVSVAEGAVQVTADADDPATIVLTWSGTPCDTEHRLEIAANGRDLAITRPPCTGDSIGVDHVLRLTFDAPVPVNEVRATLETTP